MSSEITGSIITTTEQWGTRRDRAEVGGVVDSIGRVVVIVPAHDEAERIEASLASIVAAARRSSVSVDCVIVCDSCSDETVGVARRFCDADDVVSWALVECDVRCAASSRQAGLESFVSSIGGSDDDARTAVLSTDADSVVPTDWIIRHVDWLDRGVDAIAGVVDIVAGDDTTLDESRWREEYSAGFSVDGSHPHVHAANLAIRLSTLLAAGGFGHAARAEDIDVWRRLGRDTSTNLRSDHASVVMTSTRSDGRVVGGFATALNERFRRDDPVPIEPAPTSSTR